MFAYCLNSPVHLVDSMGNTPTEAVDTDGDGEIDYYRYDYEYSYTVYLPYHNYSYEATASGSVYIFPATPIDYFENEENIPDGFNKYTDLLVADIPGAENITFYAYQAQYISARSYNIIAKILMQYDVDFNRGFNRSMESLVSEWHYHMLFGGYLGISRSANVDFDKNGDGDTLGECIMKIINAIAGK